MTVGRLIGMAPPPDGAVLRVGLVGVRLRPFFDADPNPTPDDPVKSAQFERDAAVAKAANLQKQIDDLKGQLLTPEQRKEFETLKANQTKAEEERKRKEGEFDSWRADINKQHTEVLTEREQRIATLEKEIADGEVRRAFLSATDYFGGGENSKSVLVGELAVDALGKYVAYEEYDFGGDGGKKKVVVVRDVNGNIIRGQNGRPAPFTEALDGLLKSHPGKDHILRGSGKAGSGARGEGVLDDKGKVDLSRPLTREQRRDPKVLEQLESVGGGGIQMGRGFAKAAAIGKK